LRYGSLLETIGNTPLVELRRLTPNPNVRIFAKLEGQNPTGSIKDRIAKAMIEEAEASGELEPGRELLEPTSGNTGISLALVAKVEGLKLTCVMPDNATPERRALLELYGAEIVDSPGAEGSNGAVRLAQQMASDDPRWVMLFQYANEANPRAHYEGTGAEIVRDLARVDALVAGLGTGGTLMGAGARLRESFPDVVVAAAEPLPGDPVMGLRSLEDGYVPPILDVSQLDRKLLVSNRESVVAVRALLELYGAEIVDSPGEEGSNGAVRKAQEIAARDPRYVMLFQYANEANPQAHYEGTGGEIVRDLDRVDALVAGLGTGGTLMGAGRRIREANPEAIVVAAEPLPGDPVMGLRSLEDGYVPPILDVSQLDRKLVVSNRESVVAVRALLEREGIFAGVSAGAVVHVARRVAEELPEGSTVVCVLADGGWKYLSASFWDSADEEIEESMEATLWW